MKVNVMGKEIVLCYGASVRDALLRYFTKFDIRRDVIESVTAKDQWENVLDLDAPVSDGQNITFSLGES